MSFEEYLGQKSRNLFDIKLIITIVGGNWILYKTKRIIQDELRDFFDPKLCGQALGNSGLNIVKNIKVKIKE